MEKVKNNIIWAPDEIIYAVDSKPDGIFIIVSGTVKIYARDGLLLNSIGEKELLGETSTILNKKRSVTAKAGPNGASAIYINKKDQRLRRLPAFDAKNIRDQDFFLSLSA